MSKKKRVKEGETAKISQHAAQRAVRRTRNLRVLEGGRDSGRASARPAVQATARRGGLSSRVKRRRRIALAILVVLAAGLITYILLGPVTRLVESQRNLAQAEAQLEEEKSRTRALEERKAWDMTDRFVELEAREMGYVKPGEIPIIVLDNEEEESSSGNTANPAEAVP